MVWVASNAEVPDDAGKLPPDDAEPLLAGEDVTAAPEDAAPEAAPTEEATPDGASTEEATADGASTDDPEPEGMSTELKLGADVPDGPDGMELLPIG